MTPILFWQPSSTQSTAIMVIIILLVYVFLRRRALTRANLHNLPYPPGPKPWPLLGNISDIATCNQVEAYQDLAKRHGECRTVKMTIYSRNVYGQATWFSSVSWE